MVVIVQLLFRPSILIYQLDLKRETECYLLMPDKWVLIRKAVRGLWQGDFIVEVEGGQWQTGCQILKSKGKSINVRKHSCRLYLSTSNPRTRRVSGFEVRTKNALELRKNYSWRYRYLEGEKTETSHGEAWYLRHADGIREIGTWVNRRREDQMT